MLVEVLPPGFHKYEIPPEAVNVIDVVVHVSVPDVGDILTVGGVIF